MSSRKTKSRSSKKRIKSYDDLLEQIIYNLGTTRNMGPEIWNEVERVVGKISKNDLLVMYDDRELTPFEEISPDIELGIRAKQELAEGLLIDCLVDDILKRIIYVESFHAGNVIICRRKKNNKIVGWEVLSQ